MEKKLKTPLNTMDGPSEIADPRMDEGAVDPHELAARLRELAADEEGPSELQGEEGEGDQGAEAEGTELPEDTPEQEPSTGRFQNFDIRSLDSETEETADNDNDVYKDIDKFIIYGNVKIFLPEYQILLEENERTRPNRSHPPLASEPSSDGTNVRLDVEYSTWSRRSGCGKCPSAFNCTCAMDVVDVIRQLMELFDLVLIPDNYCATCLQV